MINSKSIEDLEKDFLNLKIENEQRISKAEQKLAKSEQELAKAELTTVKRVQVLFLAIVPAIGLLFTLSKIFG